VGKLGRANDPRFLPRGDENVLKLDCIQPCEYTKKFLNCTLSVGEL
jgi:hypothetical protein